MLFTQKTIGDFLEEQVQIDPDHEFIVYPDRDLRFTYSQFNERVDNLAKGLLAIGISKGDHLGIWSRNVPDWLTFMFATAKIGVVLVTINTYYKIHELEYVIKQSDIKALAIIDSFRDTNYLDIVNKLVPELEQSFRGDLKSGKFPFLKSVIYIGQEKHRGMYNTNELLLLGQYGDAQEFLTLKKTIKSDDVVNMQYTSGTTGFPKGVMLSHKNILNNGHSIGERQKFTYKDRLCLPVPLFHCFGMVLGVMAILSHRATLVMLEIFDPLLALAAIQKEKCTALYGVPTMFIAEFTHPMFDMFDMSSLRTGIMAGSTCPVEVMKSAVNNMNMKEITSVYGLTEASPGITQTMPDDTIEIRVSTVGKAFLGVEVKVADPDTGQTLGPDKVGEICCRGYNVMKGYYKMPEETEQVIDADGWLHSGDLGVCDKNGYYKITGRIKDMIIRGGENIYPREIEEFIHTIEGIEDVQVVGIPDEKYGEVVAAFIIAKKNYNITEAKIRGTAAKQIAKYKVPKHIFFVDQYPLTASGKIQKYKLKDIFQGLIEKKNA